MLPRASYEPRWSSLMAEVGVLVEDKATADWALYLKVWAPLDLTDARDRDPVPVASGTRQ